MIEIHNIHGELLARLDLWTLARQDLSGAGLLQVDLYGADLHGINFSHANLEHAQMTGANLEHATLHHTNFRHALLTQANLHAADCHAALLAPADLRGADLSGVNFTDADLRGSHLDEARYDHATRWPAGFDPHKHGALLVLTEEEKAEIDRHAVALLKAHKPREAIALLNDGLQHKPRCPRLHRYLACAYVMTSDMDHARRHFATSLEIDPLCAQTHYDLALLLVRMGQTVEAAKHAESALRLSPQFTKAATLLHQLRAPAAGD